MNKVYILITSCCDSNFRIFVDDSRSGSPQFNFGTYYKYISGSQYDGLFNEGDCYKIELLDDPNDPLYDINYVGIEFINMDDYFEVVDDCGDEQCNDCCSDCCNQDSQVFSYNNVNESFKLFGGEFKVMLYFDDEPLFEENDVIQLFSNDINIPNGSYRVLEKNTPSGATGGQWTLVIDLDWPGSIINTTGEINLKKCCLTADFLTNLIDYTGTEITIPSSNFDLSNETDWIFVQIPNNTVELLGIKLKIGHDGDQWFMDVEFDINGVSNFVFDKAFIFSGDINDCPIGDWILREDNEDFTIDNFFDALSSVFGFNFEFGINTSKTNCEGCGGDVCIINLEDGEYLTSNMSFLNYKGWFFKVDNIVTDYYISDIEILENELKLIIIDSNGIPVNIDFCSKFCLVKKESTLKVPNESLDVLKVGDEVFINSSCYDNNSFFVSSINQNGIKVYSKEYSDLCVNIGSINLVYIRSINKYNDNYHYQSVYDDQVDILYLLIVFNDQLNRWEHFILNSPFDGVEILNIQIIDGPVSHTDDLLNDWITLTQSSYSEISTKYCDFFINCEGNMCIDYNTSSLQNKWVIIDSWEMDKEYNEGDIVIFDDILYNSNTQSKVEDPTVLVNGVQIKSGPFNSNDWDIYSDSDSIFWNPNKNYSTNNNFFDNVVYNNGEFYEYISGGDDFWNPVKAMTATGYGLGDTVIYKGKYYYSMTSSNHYTIDYTVGKENDMTLSWKKPNNTLFRPWVATQSINPSWKVIEIWNPSLNYSINEYVIHMDKVWISNDSVEPGEEPSVSSLWNRQYNILPELNFKYSTTNNKIIFMNNNYYLSTSFSGVELDNGIIIYINKKWKNIFINITINDSTLPNLSNSDRDLIYNEIYYNLTANNFIQAINDLSNKYGFANYLKYVVIDEENNISEYSYNDNITELKYIIEAGYPDQFSVKLNSLDKKYLEKPNTLNPTRVLNNFKVDLSNLNWYNNLPISVSIDENLSEIKKINNLHGLINITSNDLYRFSGYYMPIFYDIELFKKADDFEEIGNWRFDTSLTDFGILKERKLRKVNRKDSILKLKNDQEYRSIYPMLDEFGLTTVDFFIFKSTWDYKYYIESNFVSLNIINRPIKEDIIIDNKLFGKAKIDQNKNLNI